MSNSTVLPVRKAKCRTCPFREDGWTHVRSLLEQRALTEGSPICHSSGKALTRHDGERVKAHICRGARDFQLTIFHRLGVIAEPTDAAWEQALEGLSNRSPISF